MLRLVQLDWQLFTNYSRAKNGTNPQKGLPGRQSE